MAERTIKVYVTRRALTEGIEVGKTGSKRIKEKKIAIHCTGITWLGREDWVWKPDWHLTKQDAVHQAQLMRARRIESLRGQLTKLGAMVFRVEE